MYAVVMEAYVNGVSTRSVDALVAALGVDTGISKSEVSRICAGLDERVAAFRNRTLGHTEFPYVYLDATYGHVRDDALGQVVSRAVVIATGITDQRREMLGVDIGDSEDATFWTRFLRSLKDRGLTGVPLVISDAHEGLKAPSAAASPAPAGKGRPSTCLLSGRCPLVVSAVGRGPWQRDRSGPTADSSLPALANLEPASGSRASMRPMPPPMPGMRRWWILMSCVASRPSRCWRPREQGASLVSEIGSGTWNGFEEPDRDGAVIAIEIEHADGAWTMELTPF